MGQNDDWGEGLRYDTPAQRLAAWNYVIESLVGGLTDEGVLMWLTVHGPVLSKLVSDAAKVRDGMVAT